MQKVSQTAPPPERNGVLAQPGMVTPLLLKGTVPPPSAGSTKAWKLTGWPSCTVLAVEVTSVALAAAVAAPAGVAIASNGTTSAAVRATAPILPIRQTGTEPGS